jgi:alpha-L-fucosidase
MRNFRSFSLRAWWPLLVLVVLPLVRSAEPAVEMDTSSQKLPEAELRQAGVAAAVKAMPPGPVQMTWESVRANYQTPEWFRDAKFGLFMHWGIYSVPAHGSEWYVRYMYGGNAGFVKWHAEHFGPQDKFGYKDFIPMFTAAKWDPDAWAELFKQSGAKYVIPSGEHHDGFSLWDSATNKYNAKNMGPKRDLIGDLAVAVRKQGLKFGVSNHSNNHFNFIPAMPGSDQYDPAWAEFYSVADRSDPARKRFLEKWVAKNFELIDQYQPDILWFDMNGGDRSWDAQKLAVAAYYYNRALAWKKPVSISAKGASFLGGMIMDYERQGRILPRGLKDFAWEVDDPMGNKFAYVTEMTNKPAALLVRRLVDCVSMNGNYLLNISPKADGTIPDEQQERLRAMGRWLAVNGEAIYGSRPWVRYGEGPYYDAPPDTSPSPGPDDPPHESYTGKEIRFTTQQDTLYAIVMDWPGEEAVITALAAGAPPLPAGKIRQVELLGHAGALAFTQDAAGLHVKLPPDRPCDFAYALKIIGLKLAADPR